MSEIMELPGTNYTSLQQLFLNVTSSWSIRLPHLREVVSNIGYGINYFKHVIWFFQEKIISRNQNMVDVIKLGSEFIHDQCQKSFILNTK